MAYCKYYKQRKYKSYDNEHWIAMDEYRKGSVYERDSDCVPTSSTIEYRDVIVDGEYYTTSCAPQGVVIARKDNLGQYNLPCGDIETDPIINMKVLRDEISASGVHYYKEFDYGISMHSTTIHTEYNGTHMSATSIYVGCEVAPRYRFRWTGCCNCSDSVSINTTTQPSIGDEEAYLKTVIFSPSTTVLKDKYISSATTDVYFMSTTVPTFETTQFGDVLAEISGFTAMTIYVPSEAYYDYVTDCSFGKLMANGISIKPITYANGITCYYYKLKQQMRIDGGEWIDTGVFSQGNLASMSPISSDSAKDDWNLSNEYECYDMSKWEVWRNGNASVRGALIEPFSCNVSYDDYKAKIMTKYGESITYPCGVIENPTWYSDPTKLIVKQYWINGQWQYIAIEDECKSPISTIVGHCTNEVGLLCYSGFKDLKEAYIGNTVQNLGTMSFCGCTSLSSITFEETSRLTSIGNGMEYAGWMDGHNVSVGGYVFQGCTSLSSFTMPSTVNWIGENSFADCTALTLATIPQSLEFIGEHVWSGCTSLTSATLSNGLSYLTDAKIINREALGLFKGCTSIENVTIESGLTQTPEEVFSGCTSLSSITFAPNSQLTKIGNSAFTSCGFEELTLPEGIEVLGRGAFRDNANLTAVTLPSTITSIGYACFVADHNLESFTILATVPPSHGGVILNNTSEDLVIYVPCGSVQAYKEAWTLYADRIEGIPPCDQPINFKAKINGQVVVECGSRTDLVNSEISAYSSSATSIVVGDCVTTLGDSTFSGFTNLTSIEISSSVTRINSYCFRECTSLTNLIIPSSVTNIGRGLFADSPNVTSVRVEATVPPSLTSSSFDGASPNLVVYVPLASLSTYQSASNWEYLNLQGY